MFKNNLMKRIITCLLLIFLANISLAYCQDYSFESFTKSFHDLTGDPFMELNIKGMKNSYFSFSGPFQEIADRAEIIFKDMEISAPCPEVAEGANIARDHLAGKGISFEEQMMRKINEDIYISITWEKGEETLLISEMDLSAFRDSKEN